MNSRTASVSFIINGTVVETKPSVSGQFSFQFEQKNLKYGSNSIGLTATPECGAQQVHKEFRGVRTREHSQERDGALGRIFVFPNIRQTIGFALDVEAYFDNFVYDIEATETSKLVWVENLRAAVEIVRAPTTWLGIASWSPELYLQSVSKDPTSGEETKEKYPVGVPKRIDVIQKPNSPHTVKVESQANAWFEPDSNVSAHADTIEFRLIPTIGGGSLFVNPFPPVFGRALWDVETPITSGGTNGQGSAPAPSEIGSRLAASNGRINAPPEPGVCARVTIKIDQEAVMTRTAFRAELQVDNSSDDTAVNDVFAEIEIRTIGGDLVNSLFGILGPELINLLDVRGNGVVSPLSFGRASWTIIPSDQAAPTQPTVYYVGGTLAYTYGLNRVAIPLEPIAITVRPDAALNLKYFHQRDVFSDDPHTDPVVEPAIPYTLAVMVENNGAGVAKNLRITSAQPRIIENEKGLLIDFQIIATEVFSALGFSQLTPSLIANFGDIAPDEIKIARWLLTSTLQGQFVDYKATFEHIDGLGDTRLSLIKSVEIFEMIRQVYSPDDALPDFLTNEVPDAPEDLPDTIHLSDGTVHSVALAGASSFDASAPSVVDPVVELTVDMAAGWGYLRTHDIGDGRWRLTRVVRSDGTEIDPDNFWQTDRTFIEQGHRPRLENNLHLVDRDSTGRYTLYYTPLDTSPPSVESLQQVSPNPRNEPVPSLDVLFTEKLASVDVAAIRLTRDGGPNLIGPGVTITPV